MLLASLVRLRLRSLWFAACLVVFVVEAAGV